MKKLENNIFNNITKNDILLASIRAFKGHNGKREVKNFKKDLDNNCYILYCSLKNDTWKNLISYRKLVKVNSNGKVRNIDSPSLITRIYQHLFLNLIEKYYYKLDNNVAVNCKPKHGITAKIKSNSVVKRLKNIFYDHNELKYYLMIDQRKCYDHIKVSIFRKELKKIISDKKFIDFAISICFINGKLPIGTPTSPLVHHITLLYFDYFLNSLSKHCIRYADNCFIAFETKEEANEAKWRIKNYWWYELKIRAKKQSIIISPITTPCSFCGFIFHKNNNKGITNHNKGFVTVRDNILRRARKCRKNESWASYFGILQHSDSFTVMKNIEENMKLSDLTSKVKINRTLDAKNIEIKELLGRKITIIDYEIKYTSQKEANWIKCLIGIEETEGEFTGRYIAREFHGNYQGIIQFILQCEKTIGLGKKENILPIEEVEIENQCGYIFKGSTNQIEFIDEIISISPVNDNEYNQIFQQKNLYK